MTRPSAALTQLSFGSLWVIAWLGVSCTPIETVSGETARDAGTDREPDEGKGGQGGEGGAAGASGEVTVGAPNDSGSGGGAAPNVGTMTNAASMTPSGAAGAGANGMDAPVPLPDICTAGETRCTGRKIASCVDGEWKLGSDCPFVCTEGECTGTCTPTAKQCRDNVPQTCDETGEWVNGEACPNVCDKGECVGMCPPGSTQCSDNTAQSCEGGQWVDDQDCPYVCEDGVCTGVCKPNALQCAGNTPQRCDEHGQWVSEPACENVCDEKTGKCGGQCPPGMTSCIGTRPRTCNAQGAWENGEIRATVCNAVCTPGEKKCVGTQEQICNATGTRWDNQPIRANVCDACAPGETKCDTVRRIKETCTPQGTWRNDGVSMACGAECNPGETGCAGNIAEGMPGECTASAQAGTCWFGWTVAGVVFKRVCDASGRWTKQPCTGTCTVPASGGAAAGMPAHFCTTRGSTSVCIASGTCPL